MNNTRTVGILRRTGLWRRLLARGPTGLLLLIGVLAAGGCRQQTHYMPRGPAVPANPIVKSLPDHAPPQLKQMLDGVRYGDSAVSGAKI